MLIKEIVHSPIADFYFDVLFRFFCFDLVQTQEKPIETLAWVIGLF